MGGLSVILSYLKTGWLRRYRVRAYGRPDQRKLLELKKGITLEDVHYRGVDVDVERQQGGNVWLTISLREGKNREVKKLLSYVGLEVNRLIRLSFGPFQLGNLETGAVEEVPRRVLRQQLGSTWSDIAEGARAAGQTENPKQANGRPPRKETGTGRKINQFLNQFLNRTPLSRQKSHKEKSQSDKPPKNLPEKNMTPWKMSETKTTSKKKTLKLKNK